MLRPPVYVGKADGRDLDGVDACPFADRGRKICGVDAEMPARTFGVAIGELIYQRRKAVGLTQTQLSEDAFGTAAKTRRISELENGLVANPHPKTLDPIINVLRISEDEVEACARETAYKPDEDLDRAYREARNLIEAAASRFEHANPTASLSELDDFLRLKAKEWRELRERLEQLDSPTLALDNLKNAATAALAAGDFEEVDHLLAQAEDVYQNERTLTEVYKQVEIRTLRGDSAYLKGDRVSAAHFYATSADMLVPFSPREAIDYLSDHAGIMYETERRSFDPSFVEAVSLLEKALSIPSLTTDRELLGAISYRLSLICRNAAATKDRDLSNRYLSDALKYSSRAINLFEGTSCDFELASSQVSHANCTMDHAKRARDPLVTSAAVDSIRDTLSRMITRGAPPRLIAHMTNTLGAAMSDQIVYLGEDAKAEVSLETFKIFQRALQLAEEVSDLDVWSASNINMGRSLGILARAKTEDAHSALLLRIRAISHYQAALEAFPQTAFPMHAADCHLGVSSILIDHARHSVINLAEVYLARAVGHYGAAFDIFETASNKAMMAYVQLQFGKISAIHSQMIKDNMPDVAKDDLNRATEYITSAKEICLDLGDLAELKKCDESLREIGELLSELD